MSVGRVVRHFQVASKLPVDIEEVLAFVQKLNPDEVIEVHSVETNPSILKGMHVRLRIPPTLPGSMIVDTVCNRVIYSSRLSLKEQRLVCVKELLHVLDPDPILTTKKKEVLDLAEKLVNQNRPPTRLTRKSDVRAFLDSLAKWQALSVLFPFGLWEEWMPQYQCGAITAESISDQVQVPVEYIEVVMDSGWEAMRDAILSFT